MVIPSGRLASPTTTPSLARTGGGRGCAAMEASTPDSSGPPPARRYLQVGNVLPVTEPVTGMGCFIWSGRIIGARDFPLTPAGAIESPIFSMAAAIPSCLEKRWYYPAILWPGLTGSVPFGLAGFTPTPSSPTAPPFPEEGPA